MTLLQSDQSNSQLLNGISSLEHTLAALDLEPLAPITKQVVRSPSDSIPERLLAARILIVDDESYSVLVLRKFLQQNGYSQVLSTTEPQKSLDLIRRERPDLVLLDVTMSQVSGLELLQVIKADETTSKIPIIMLTDSSEAYVKTQALKMGVSDFLSKPVDSNELLIRVRNVLTMKLQFDDLSNQSSELARQVRERTRELSESRRQVILCLARACEFRDNDTGSHIIRVGKYAGIIARELGFDEDQVEALELASQLHDIGKIGIPDAILNKPGKLDPDEYEIIHKHCSFGKHIIGCRPADEWATVKTHTSTGAKMLDAKASPVLALAARIALTHHEWWNGEGYPLGLSGNDIPIEGRITAVADVYDALSCKRAYKKAFSREKCFSMLDEGRGKHFDPLVLDAFFRRGDEVVETQIHFSDDE